MNAPQQLDLSHFYGSQSFTRFGLTKNVSSEGVTHFAEEMSAFWLLDSISALLEEMALDGKAVDFAVIKIKRTIPNAARIVIEDGNDEEIHTHQVGFTDLAFDRLPDDFQIWAARNELGSFTLYLPSEH
ncbi:MAG: hypothetical protein CMO44_19435 [Verrucomicrobiales bacterium]|mgnify:CR=1 FL=1|nr:hypothetical protein [Verrucomicrobiales bacterium]|tara:strand:- start:7233 stop:7619 length:387 start_codon:yes stop_codon:yes gene_type:complete